MKKIQTHIFTLKQQKIDLPCFFSAIEEDTGREGGRVTGPLIIFVVIIII